MAADILIVDDETDIRSILQGILGDEGYLTRQAASSAQAYEEISKKAPDLIILDIWLENSDQDGLQILANVKAEHPFVPVLMISGHGTIETAVSAIKKGAYDFIEKPFKYDRLLVMIERALETAKLRRENQSLRLKAEGPSDLIGESPAMATLRQAVGRVAQTNSRVLLTGEPGTGKDLLARTIHRQSQRENGPFMAINCAILRPERLEIELFGAEEGAMGEPFQTGVLEKADKGTLFLDEVADMPLETQGKILRVLQDQKFQRVGGERPIEVDVRFIASSNQDLKALIGEGRFREDLYYRLNVVPLELPTLRSRPQDIPVLAEYFAEIYSNQAGIPPCRFEEATLAAMQLYEWPGNVRQLRNVIEWVMIMGGAGEGEAVKPAQLPPELGKMEPRREGDVFQAKDIIGLPLREAREKFERHYIQSQIRRFGGNISKTAEFVGMERSALHRKIKQLGVGEDEAEAELVEAGDETRKIA